MQKVDSHERSSLGEPATVAIAGVQDVPRLSRYIGRLTMTPPCAAVERKCPTILWIQLNCVLLPVHAGSVLLVHAGSDCALRDQERGKLVSSSPARSCFLLHLPRLPFIVACTSIGLAAGNREQTPFRTRTAATYHDAKHRVCNRSAAFTATCDSSNQPGFFRAALDITNVWLMH